MNIYSISFVIILAYLLGSIPTAVWVGRLFFNTDVRAHGSGNAGTTNTFRVLGKKAAIPVLLVDVLKGFFAVKVLYLLPHNDVFLVHTIFSESFMLLQIVLAIAALIGHIFPVFARFKGGKGIATLFGAIIAIHWQAAVAVLIIFVIMLTVFGYVSLASLTAAISFPVLTILVFHISYTSFQIFSLLLAILVIITHRKNINRLLKGEESKIFKSSQKNTKKQNNSA